jgi:glucoamylase
MALGDRASANRALNYLFRVQQRADGSFPQNSRVDGRAIGTAVQMDQVAYSLILAYQLSRNDSATWQNHIRPAADFIMRKGPATEQERWEEERGYSPATIAAEIAGLVCAADIARVNSDLNSATAYLEKADGWARKVESWTATSTGRYGHYYLRVTENDNPDDGATLNINSGGGDHDERDIVDAGFLELVRLGIKRADNPLIMKSLEIVDRLIKVETANGSAWYRYNRDAYGEREDGSGYDGRRGKGRPWPLLTGERGEYEIAQGDIEAARRRLDDMLGFANDGRMLPEQIWDERDLSRHDLRLGEGTGSATPLGWAMAQFIRLATNIRQDRNMETPPIVSSRYQMMQR